MPIFQPSDQAVTWTVKALRARVAEHNRQVLLLALLTLLIAASLWYVAYAALYWLTLLALTVKQGFEARPPEFFPTLYIYSAGLLVLVTWLASRFSPHEVLRDRKTWLATAADFLLGIPRATLAVWGNLSAYQRLTDEELRYAATLLAWIAKEKRLPLSRVPLEIPDRGMRQRIVLALQLAQLLQVNCANSGPVLTLPSRGTLARAD